MPDLESWLRDARGLFRALFGNTELRIIVSPVGSRRGVEMRTDAETDLDSQVVQLREEPASRIITALDLSGRPGDTPRVEVGPVQGLPLIEPVELDGNEVEVLEILQAEKGRLMAKEIAHKLAGPNTGRFRSRLSLMKRRGLLDHTGGAGYGLTLRGQLSLAAWSANQMFPESGDMEGL